MLRNPKHPKSAYYKVPVQFVANQPTSHPPMYPHEK